MNRNAQGAADASTEYRDRLEKLKLLRERGINPYPDRYARSHFSGEALVHAEQNPPRAVEEIIASPRAELRLSGRLLMKRTHGRLAFAHLKDARGKIQLCFMENVLGSERYQDLRLIDAGDFLGVSGELFVTKHGEISLLVIEYTLLSKTLRPMPEKFHGLADRETRYRQRYLDLIADDETMRRFLLRSAFISALRSFLTANDFLEIETPVLQNQPSGAVAKPFLTHHNSLDLDVYLRIAPETYLKRAMVGGFERVFEFARCFRNEGMDPSHLQEFTMLEYYAAYWNYEDNMDFTEKLIRHVLLELLGTLSLPILDQEGKETLIDFARPWPRVAFRDLILQDSGIDISVCADKESLLKAIKAKAIKLEYDPRLGWGNLVDVLYKKVSRPRLVQPTFVIHHPADTKPLARRNDLNPQICDTFQLLVNTWEIINAYSEIVDPPDQRQRLENQALAKAAGDEEAMDRDEDYLRAMEHGMPPMSGWGMGIDRFLALITKQANLRDVVLFPLLRPLLQND